MVYPIDITTISITQKPEKDSSYAVSLVMLRESTYSPFVRSVKLRISLGRQNRIRGPHVPVPLHTITVIPYTS
jgi:hypothetical protein